MRIIFLLRENFAGIDPREETAEQTLLYNDNKKRAMYNKIDLRTVVLLENEYTMDLFCNPHLVEDINKVKKHLTIQINDT